VDLWHLCIVMEWRDQSPWYSPGWLQRRIPRWVSSFLLLHTRPKQPPSIMFLRTGVFVSNHSSMIDFIILQQSHSYAVVRVLSRRHLLRVQYVLSLVFCRSGNNTRAG
jgi:hypothetical protein